jgi:hypothetical protein
LSKTWNTEDSKQPEITKHDLTHEQGTWGGNRSLPTSTYILYILLINHHPEVTAENQEKKHQHSGSEGRVSNPGHAEYKASVLSAQSMSVFHTSTGTLFSTYPSLTQH